MRDVTLMPEWLPPLLPERGMRSHFNSWGAFPGCCDEKTAMLRVQLWSSH